jgi:hypothetical protein
MQGVEFKLGKPVNVVFDPLERHKVARDIEVAAAPNEARCVFYCGAVAQLTQRLETIKNTRCARGGNLCSVWVRLESVSFWIFNIVFGNVNATCARQTNFKRQIQSSGNFVRFVEKSTICGDNIEPLEVKHTLELQHRFWVGNHLS